MTAEALHVGEEIGVGLTSTQTLPEEEAAETLSLLDGNRDLRTLAGGSSHVESLPKTHFSFKQKPAVLAIVISAVLAGALSVYASLATGRVTEQHASPVELVSAPLRIQDKLLDTPEELPPVEDILSASKEERRTHEALLDTPKEPPPVTDNASASKKELLEAEKKPCDAVPKQADDHGEPIRIHHKPSESQERKIVTPTPTILTPKQAPAKTKSVAPLTKVASKEHSAEKKIDEMLSLTKRLVQDSSWTSDEGEALEQQVLALSSLKNSLCFSRMDSLARADLTLQVAALQATCIYLAGVSRLKGSISDLRDYLATAHGSRFVLDKLVTEHIYVPTTSVENGKAEAPEAGNKDEKRSLQSALKPSSIWGRINGQLHLTKFLASVEAIPIDDTTSGIIRSHFQRLLEIWEATGHVVEEAVQVLDEAQRYFSWSDTDTVSSCTALKDFFKMSTRVAGREVEIWGRIANGEKPMEIKDIQSYHDQVTTLHIYYDCLVRRGVMSPLPRGLVELLNPCPSLNAPGLKLFEKLRQKFISWANVLLDNSASDESQRGLVSAGSFDFTGLMWQPFTASCRLRRSEEKDLMMRTNYKLSVDRDAAIDFAGALKRAGKDGRPSLNSIPIQWRAEPVRRKKKW